MKKLSYAEKHEYDLQSEVEALVKDYPSLKEFYYEKLPELLGCPFEEIVVLNVLPEAMKIDEEGWMAESFFGDDIVDTVIYDNYHTDEFCIGLIGSILYQGNVFIYETNASPLLVYANKSWFN